MSEVSQLTVEPGQEAAEVIGEKEFAADVQIGQHDCVHPSWRPTRLPRGNIGENQIPRVKLPALPHGDVRDDQAVKRQG